MNFRLVDFKGTATPQSPVAGVEVPPVGEEARATVVYAGTEVGARVPVRREVVHATVGQHSLKVYMQSYGLMQALNHL